MVALGVLLYVAIGGFVMARLYPSPDGWTMGAGRPLAPRRFMVIAVFWPITAPFVLAFRQSEQRPRPSTSEREPSADATPSPGEPNDPAAETHGRPGMVADFVDDWRRRPRRSDAWDAANRT